MSDLEREFADVESASFLHSEDKEAPLRDGLLRPDSRWRLWPLISRLLPYVVLMLASFGVGRYTSGNEATETSLRPPQSISGSSKIVVFKPDESYNDDPFGPDGRYSAWSKLTPPGKGHVRVENPAAWKLSGGFPLHDETQPEAEEYTIAVFHQLHCLAAIKSKMSKLQDWYKGDNDREYLAFTLAEEHMRDDHVYHCFDYIRQALMCSGDTTLEKARTVDGKVARGVDGWDVEHQCRDYDAIYAYAAAHRSNNLTGID